MRKVIERKSLPGGGEQRTPEGSIVNRMPNGNPPTAPEYGGAGLLGYNGPQYMMPTHLAEHDVLRGC
jgi:hypothetical protein